LKRRDLVRHLERHGCRIQRDTGPHTFFVDASMRRASAVPRHREINDFLVRKICRDLDVPVPLRG